MSRSRAWSNVRTKPSTTPAPAAGGGFGMPQAPAGGFGMPQQPNPVNPISPGMPGTQGGGSSTDTGGLDANPGGGGGFGGGQPTIYSPTFGGDTTNTYNTSRTYNRSNTNYDMSRRNTTTNIDNSQTTMGQGQRVQRQKTKAQLNPFQAINPEMEQKMIGDPSNPISQLRIMRGR